MTRIALTLTEAILLALLVSCIAFAPAALPAVPSAAAAPPTAAAPIEATPSSVAEMDLLIATAREASGSNHLSEAIRGFVSVIAIYEASPSAERRSRADTAAGELASIGGRLSLEPSGEWMDAGGTQAAGVTRGVGREGSLQPSVYLFENFGSGKSPVPDAPIYFEFVENSGSLVQTVSTDAYGKANTTLARIDEPGREAVVRAYPLFRAGGKTYPFRSVFRDFAYLPPANVATVAVLESSAFSSSDNPQVADAVIAALKPSGLQLSPFNGKLAPEAFLLAFGGDGKALASIGAGSSYTAFALVEAGEVRQMEYNGVKYSIFSCAVKAGFRLVRADGTVVYSLPIDQLKGQGGSPEAAVADGFKRAREALGPAIQRALPEIRAALEKE